MGPTQLQIEHIQSCHNSLAGHNGVQRTVARLHEARHRWTGMRAHVADYIKNCAACAKTSQVHPHNIPQAFTASAYGPMERWSIDFVGPFHDGGHVLTIVDDFSRYVELHPAEAATAQAAATGLMLTFGSFGAPKILHSDKGAPFVSKLIKEFAALVGAGQQISIAYSHQENAIVERRNKELNKHLRTILFDRNIGHDYKAVLPLVKRIMNSTVNATTQVAPADLMYGHMINPNVGIFLPEDQRPVAVEGASAHLAHLLTVQDRIMRITAKLLRQQDNEHLESAPIPTTITVGSYVLVRPPYGSRPPSRLYPIWAGPYLVTHDLGQSAYRVRHMSSQREYSVHISRMKEFYSTIPEEGYVAIAARDFDEHVVTAVLSHSGDFSELGAMDFECSLEGIEDHLWFPWSEVKDNPLLHEYLRSINQAKRIPREHRKPQ